MPQQSTFAALLEKFRAGYPAVYLNSSEDMRAQRDIKMSVQKLNSMAKDEKGHRKLFVWTFGRGLQEEILSTKEEKKKTSDKYIEGTSNPDEVLEHIRGIPAKSVVILRQFHHFLEDARIQSYLLDLVPDFKATQRSIIITSAKVKIPEELEKEFALVESILPTKEELRPVLEGILEASNLGKDKQPSKQRVEEMLEAALGMTTAEADNAFALSYARARLADSPNLWDPKVVLEEKCAALKKTGLLEYIPAPVGGMNAIGGMQNLKEWVAKRKRMFTDEAKKFGLSPPKGILLVGPPGSGKSAGAKAISGELGLPLLKCDMGKMFGSLVGQSEANIRNAIKTAEAIAPCILWIDEIEKGLAGSSAGALDSGVGARVLGTLLTWMQEKESPVFVYATANDVTGLPPELLRKGRFDEMFSVMLPGKLERKEIFEIHLKKRGRTKVFEGMTAQLDEHVVGDRTEGFSGAEIESVVHEAMVAAFDESKEITFGHIVNACDDTIPLSRQTREKLEKLKEWCKDRTRSANKTEGKPSTKAGRQLDA